MNEAKSNLYHLTPDTTRRAAAGVLDVMRAQAWERRRGMVRKQITTVQGITAPGSSSYALDDSLTLTLRCFGRREYAYLLVKGEAWRQLEGEGAAIDLIVSYLTREAVTA